MKFHVVDSLTGRLTGRLLPTEWEWTDPLTGNATGWLKLELPDREQVATALRLVQHRIRWLAVEADDGSFPVAGPFTSPKPGREGGEITVPFADWRLWFRRVSLHPDDGDYVVRDREQMTIMRELMMRAFTANVGPTPSMVVDGVSSSEQERDATFRAIRTKVGDALDQIANRAGGPEWWTYVTRVSDTQLLPHVAAVWPERGGGTIRLAVEEGKGSNVASYLWPVGGEAPTRVWALGEGEPPAQVYANDDLPELAEETDIVWEEVVGPLSGVTRVGTAFEHAEDRLDATSGLSGQAVFRVAADKISVESVQVGGRARLVLDDGWERIDLPACRIIKRKVTGGVRKPTMQELTLDLADSVAPGAEDPGVLGTEEGE